ncbi:hypothetical protein APS67_005360 [Streptomyces sp. AVP053U2]|nr:hypothetical protein APS67_005360 [Streptomyces sp. AVP053U2]
MTAGARSDAAEAYGVGPRVRGHRPAGRPRPGRPPTPVGTGRTAAHPNPCGAVKGALPYEPVGREPEGFTGACNR